MTTQPRVAVSILNWNGLNLTKQCVRNLLASTVLPDTIMVLDNGSSANEAVYLQKNFTAPVTVLRSATNLGFAGGNNYVINRLREMGSYDYIVLLNQDALVQPDCLEKIVNYLEAQPTVAVAGPLVLNTNGTIQSCGADIHRWSGKII
ncbi:MAG: glycosyl transferase family protein, partial [uncultured bacterium]